MQKGNDNQDIVTVRDIGLGIDPKNKSRLASKFATIPLHEQVWACLF